MSLRSIHSGHRERLRNRFIQTGTNGFQEHELLELMLFYALPRVNTNEISHRLIEKFGSLSAVFDADAEEIASVKGLSLQSAAFIGLMRDLCRSYALSAHNSVKLNSKEQINKFFIDYFSRADTEICLILSIGMQFEVLGKFSFPAESLRNGEVVSRNIAEMALSNGIRRIIIGQNHISGAPFPYESDYAITKMISETLVPLGVEVYDHIICGGGKTSSMRRSGAFSFSGGGV